MSEFLFTFFGVLNLLVIGAALAYRLGAGKTGLTEFLLTAPVVGFVATGLLYLAWVLSIGAGPVFYLVFEAILAVVLVYPICQRHSFTIPDLLKGKSSGIHFIVPVVVCLLLLLIFLVWTCSLALEFPSGFWDAWSRINLKAKFLTDPSTATEAFGNHVHHPDYPLLLPTAVARFWFLTGAVSQWISGVLSVATAIWLLLLLSVFVAKQQGALIAPVALVLCLANSYFWFWAPMQYSDLLLSLLIVMAVFSFDQLLRGNLEWTGVYLFSIGAALWCKNEGIAFAAVSIVAFLILVVIPNRDIRKQVPANAIAGLFFLAVCFATTVGVKLAASAGTDLFVDDIPASQKLVDWSRYQAILRTLAKFLTGIQPVVCGLAIGCSVWNWTSRHVEFRLVSAVGLVKLIILGAVFVAMYAITPHDLEFHLEQSMDRLILQLWPPLIMAIFLIICPRPMPSGDQDTGGPETADSIAG